MNETEHPESPKSLTPEEVRAMEARWFGEPKPKNTVVISIGTETPLPKRVGDQVREAINKFNRKPKD